MTTAVDEYTAYLIDKQEAIILQLEQIMADVQKNPAYKDMYCETYKISYSALQNIKCQDPRFLALPSYKVFF